MSRKKQNFLECPFYITLGIKNFLAEITGGVHFVSSPTRFWVLVFSYHPELVSIPPFHPELVSGSPFLLFRHPELVSGSF